MAYTVMVETFVELTNASQIYSHIATGEFSIEYLFKMSLIELKEHMKLDDAQTAVLFLHLKNLQMPQEDGKQCEAFDAAEEKLDELAYRFDTEIETGK